ncbi:WD40 domain-containing protein [Nonomuraea endophytica]|uniref:WD40 repeat protein/type II secretory pathway predicted ATPase ExeA n=1 Tax=Nonomuraea endophytica TaxID=714136 RepID=A0A7W8A1Q3_9ACTN|nr:TIR domain-containing protein [Nonomuraea endophytica]MBB5077240.1 WD40 repeat protein/type II secretory pathway predicted ATPase ExeA [Nonomuraea endophytica]
MARDGRPTDIFVSYSPADTAWATWIAWQLEAAGYRTMIQDWDFVPGTNFIDFMDRGVSEAQLVVAVLSRNYLTSRYGRLEWQAALRADPDNPSNKLVTIRLEDVQLEGLLSTITWVDLLGVTDPGLARALLLGRVRESLAGRAKPELAPAFPDGTGEPAPAPTLPEPGERSRARRTPVTAPGFPPQAESARSRESVGVLHVGGPRFGRALPDPGEPFTPEDMQARIWADLTGMYDRGMPRPDLMVVSGNLTESGSLGQFGQATRFLTDLRHLIGLEPHRLAIVPGPRDVTKAAASAYFLTCEADDVSPQPPYWPKWRHFAGLFAEVFQGLDDRVFDGGQPWSMFEIPDLKVVIAGFNSTMAMSHLERDAYALLGEGQAAWFAERLRPYEERGWLRLGAIGHPARDLSDAVTYERLLAHRINLLLDGPELRPGRHRVLELTREGLRVWAPDGPDQPEREKRAWRSAQETFRADQNAPSVPGPVPDSEPEPAPPAPRPVDLLLDRLTEVCEARHERARIRRFPDHLVVTYPEDGFVRLSMVGAHVGTPATEDAERFVRQAHATGLQGELVYQGAPPERSLREDLMRRGVRLRSFTEFQGLLDLSGYVAEQTARLVGDRRYPPDLYVPQRYRALDRPGKVEQGLTDEMMRQLSADHGRFLLLLGEFGHGKTFALRELARRIPAELPHLTPIFIELRALDKAHSVDALVAAHLANHREEVIDLKAFRYLLAQGRIVLLFDGFDELVTRLTYDRAADHLSTLLAAAVDKAKIVVASRTQHFKSQSQVLTTLGERVGVLPQRRVFAVEDFTHAQIRTYLENRFTDGDEAVARMSLMEGIKDLLDLAQNPRMLSFIADLDADRLRTVATTRHTISPALLYEEILSSWLRFEEQRTSIPGSAGTLSVDELWRAVTALALRLWDTGEAFLGLAELTELAETLTDLADGQLTGPQTAHAVGTGSLMVRTDEGMFGFIHASVMEWLIARHIAAGRWEALSRRPLSALTVEFLCDLADSQALRAWLADPPADDVATANAIKISTRLRTPAQADLRGADLRGEDLSGRDLTGVDLTGADLTGATLAGTNLSRARLNSAKLAGAKLDGARLTGADLSGADLSGARLAKTDLSDVAAEGTRWHRASLINVTGTLPPMSELHGAAVVPGHPVEVHLAPAGIGVPYGFHFQTTRLPEPVAYSPDGSTLAIGNQDGGVLLCVDGQPVRTLQEHTGRVYAVTFAGDVLATGASDGQVLLWDALTGELRHRRVGHPDGVWPLRLSPDGALVAAGDADGVIHLWDTTSGDLVHDLTGHQAPVFTAAFVGGALVTGDAAGVVRVWDVATGHLTGSLDGHRGAVYRVVAGGRWLASGDEAGTVRVWNATTWALEHTLTGHARSVYCVAFSPGGNLLASGDTAGVVRLWDPASGAAHGVHTSHAAAVYQVAFSPDGHTVATGDANGAVRLQDVGGGRRTELSGHRSSVWPFAFRPDGEQLATSSNDGTVRLWEPATGRCQQVLRGHGRRISSARFSADGSMLATSGNDGIVRIWEPRTGRRLRELSGSADRLISATFAPSGPLLATSSNDGGVHFWNGATGDYERELNAETDHVWAEAFSPDGSLLATANDDDSVRVWYRPTARLLSNLADHRGRVRSIAFSPDGRFVATGCDDRLVRIWHVESGGRVATLEGHADRVYSVVFSPNGRQLASASNDGKTMVWELRPGQPWQPRLLHTLTKNVGRLWSVTFSRDGSQLATGGDDPAVRVWDTASGRLLHTLYGHARRVWSVAFSPAEDLLASAGDDGVVILWEGAERKATLLGLPEGWAALAPDGRYKLEGQVGGQFWHVVGMSRFELGELDVYLPGVRQIPLEADI